ncbi:MAG: hypothetical protein ACI9UA_001760 [Pseudoalteromonas tetraodonis]|jgi:hypothetical protein
MVGRVPNSYRPCLTQEIIDPWQNPYGYHWSPRGGGKSPEIFSSGKDEIEATDDDIRIFQERRAD